VRSQPRTRTTDLGMHNPFRANVKSQYFYTLGGKTILAPSRSPKVYIHLGARDPRNKVHPRLHQGIECNLTRSGISFCEHLKMRCAHAYHVRHEHHYVIHESSWRKNLVPEIPRIAWRTSDHHHCQTTVRRYLGLDNPTSWDVTACRAWPMPPRV
jgi:hypothetical protein